MTLEALQADRDRTIAQIASLQHDLEGVMAAAEASNGDDEHDPEGATTGFERAQLSALLDAARARLVSVQRALTELERGDYGRCQGCGEPIGAERLAARPSARTCITCASR